MNRNQMEKLERLNVRIRAKRSDVGGPAPVGECDICAHERPLLIELQITKNTTTIRLCDNCACDLGTILRVLRAGLRREVFL